MYKQFSVHNFRGIQELHLSDLERVVLLAGANNTGKTSLLEALFVHSAAGNAEVVLRVDSFRGLPQVVSPALAEAPWSAVFYGFNLQGHVELAGTLADGRQACLTLRPGTPGTVVLPIAGTEAPRSVDKVYASHRLVLERQVTGEPLATYTVNVLPQGIAFEPAPPPPLVPAFFQYTRHPLSHGDVAERFSAVEVFGHTEDIVQALQVIEPRLRKLAVVVLGGVPLLYGDLGTGRMVPVAVMGEGVARLAAMVIVIATMRGGLVLIDEIENGFHYSVLKPLWKVLGTLARTADVQIVATTHSFECIQAAYQAYSETGIADLRVIRLERHDQAHRALSYDLPTLGQALERGFEVR